MTNHAGMPQLDEREAEVYRLRVVNRLTQQQVADRLKISQQRVSQIEADARAKLPPLDLDAMRRESLELHYETQRKALALADMIGVPVTAGKDGDLVVDPTSGEFVRDYSLRLAALDTARKADIEIRKLHGLDAATKIEQSGSVRYELVGVSIEDLK